MASLQLTSLQPFSAPVIPRRMTLVAAGLDLALEGQCIQVVAPGQDPIAVISAALREAPSNELHLVAHGAPGLIELGRGIDRSALLARVAEISGWGVERIYLWSCRVGADLNFVSALQELSGARVFSSAEALGQGKSLMGSGFEALAEAVEALPWQLSVLLSLYSGGFVDETSWNVRNSQGQAISWGGPYGYGLNTTVDTNINLGGSYTFSIETQGWYNDNWANYNIYEASTGQSYLSGYIGGGSALTREFTIQGGQSNQNIDLGRASVAQANAEDANTTGVVTATISDQSISSLSGLTGTGNAYSITVTDSSVNAADLNTLDGKTTVNVNAAPVGTLAGTASAIDTAINAGSIDTAGNVAVNINSGSATVAQANNIDAQTTGVITAAVDSGSIATLNGLTGTNNAYALTVTDTSATGSDLNTLDGKTTGTINAGTVASITGTATDVKTLYASNGFSGFGDESVSVSDSVSVADANSIDGSTSGIITAAVDSGSIATLNGLTGTNNAYALTVTDTSATGSDLNTLDGKTTGTINAGTVASITGTATDVKTLYASNGFSGLGDETVSVSDSVSVADANSIDVSTSGVITAAISDTAISTLGGLTGTGNAHSITVTDSSVNAADLNTLDSKTTVNVNAAPVATLTGTASAIDTAINAGSIDTAGNVAVNINSGSTTVAQANNIDAQTTGVITAAVDSGSIATLNGLTGTNNAYALTVTDTSAAGSDLNTLDGKTTGTINAGTVASITGTATDVKTLYASNGFSGLGDESVSVSDSVSVADANSIDGSTSGVITAAISDTTISTLGGLTGTGNAYSITVTDSSVNAADLNNLDGRTTLTVNANAINSISGTATQVTTTFNSAGISNLNIGDDSITISDTTLSGSDPTSLNAGSGTDSLNSTGLFAQALSIFDSDSGTLGSITFSNLENITLGSGDDTATIGSAGALTGSLDLGSGNNFLSYSSYGNAVKATVNGTNSLSSTTAIGAGVTGVENVTLSSNDDTVNFESGGSLHSLDGGDGSDTLNLKATSGYEITLTGNDKGSFKELNSNLSTGFSAFENIYAGDADETLTFKEGASLSGTLDLGGGRNTVKIEGGTALIDAVIQGGSGSDVMAFEAPKGSQTGSITAYINAGAGDDVVQLEGGFLPIGSSSNSSPQTILGSAISDLKQSLQDAAKSGHLQKAAVEAGIDNNTSDKTRLSTIGLYFQDGNFADLPAFRLVDSVRMDGALGAYIKNANTIAVDQDWLKTASQEDINSVLVEEIGHYLDSIVNVLDTPGEEGQIFSEALLGYSTSGSKIPTTVNPDNTVSVSLDGVHLLNGEANQSIPMVGENFRPNLVVDGGAGHDKLDLSNGFDLTYSADFARSGGLGEFVNYAADPTDETLSSQFLSAKFSGFENVTLDKTSQETAAVSDLRLMGVQDTTMDSGADLAAVYGVAANSSANSSSIADGVSSYSAGFSIGIEDGSLTAGDALSTTISFGANSSADAHSVADDANAVAVGYGVGLDHTDLTAGSSLDLVIKDASQVAANAFTATGDVFAVASNDGIGATDLTAIGDSAVEAMFTFNLGNSANAITTVGNAEAVGWMGSSGLDDSSMSSGGIGVINVSVRGVNGVGAESVTGDTCADALSAMVGINNTSFDFADTSSTIASTISNETTSSSSSILGNAISGLTSTVFGLFGGTNSGDTITNTQSVSSIISDYGFSEASSVGGSATATANQSIEGITGYSLATTDSILIYSKSSIDSTASSSAEDS